MRFFNAIITSIVAVTSMVSQLFSPGAGSRLFSALFSASHINDTVLALGWVAPLIASYHWLTRSSHRDRPRLLDSLLPRFMRPTLRHHFFATRRILNVVREHTVISLQTYSHVCRTYNETIAAYQQAVAAHVERDEARQTLHDSSMRLAHSEHRPEAKWMVLSP